jgi:hypothetical protein
LRRAGYIKIEKAAWVGGLFLGLRRELAPGDSFVDFGSKALLISYVFRRLRY